MLLTIPEAKVAGKSAQSTAVLMWGSMSHWLSSVFVPEHSAVGPGAAGQR